MDKFYRMYREVETGVAPDGGKFERSYGCNGESHVYRDDKVWYDDGERQPPSFVEEISATYQGECDGTCGTEKMGVFIYPG